METTWTGPTNKFGPSMLLPNSKCFAVIQKKSVMTAHSLHTNLCFDSSYTVYIQAYLDSLYIFTKMCVHIMCTSCTSIYGNISSSQKLAIHLECNQTIQAIRHRSTETLSQDLHPPSKTYTQHYLMTPLRTFWLVTWSVSKLSKQDSPRTPKCFKFWCTRKVLLCTLKKGVPKQKSQKHK